MKKICVMKYLHARQSGSILVPESVDSVEELQAYIKEHFNEIDLDELEWDYEGTEVTFDFNGEEYWVYFNGEYWV